MREHFRQQTVSAQGKRVPGCCHDPSICSSEDGEYGNELKDQFPFTPQDCLSTHRNRGQGTGQCSGRQDTDGDKDRAHIDQSYYRKGDNHPLGQDLARVLHLLCYTGDFEQTSERNEQKPCPGNDPVYSVTGKRFEKTSMNMWHPFKNIEDER